MRFGLGRAHSRRQSAARSVDLLLAATRSSDPMREATRGGSVMVGQAGHEALRHLNIGPYSRRYIALVAFGPRATACLHERGGGRCVEDSTHLVSVNYDNSALSRLFDCRNNTPGQALIPHAVSPCASRALSQSSGPSPTSPHPALTPTAPFSIRPNIFHFHLTIVATAPSLASRIRVSLQTTGTTLLVPRTLPASLPCLLCPTLHTPTRFQAPQATAALPSGVLAYLLGYWEAPPPRTTWKACVVQRLRRVVSLSPQVARSQIFSSSHRPATRCPP
ncbi:hypothetical protein P280DRAFT_483496 [Massarina eburnea CBS 473.64]|uniref:Uncharacterized protein n=1 Tax=Massarina eburnea CBS 473.64 TaxID=1395130 RepID=A0A6A6RSB3_9PLEO|nr:hypothetical protein P280DRAFT_483496 [Massarina eburnea CBS 473.64]